MSAPRPGEALPTVVVIGGGVVGSAVAWRLARRECPVVLLERGAAPGTATDARSGRASAAAAGMLAPLKEAEEVGPFLELGLRSMERYPTFVRELEADSGLDVGFRQDGRLDVATDHEAADALHRQRRLQEEAGFESRIVEPTELRELEPGLAPTVRLALATEYDHQVDPGRLNTGLWTAARGAGADARGNAPVAGVVHEGGAVTGVRLATGEVVRADVVVVAAGAWSGRLDLPRPLPVRPVRGQIVVLRTDAPVLSRTVWLGHTYLVPRADGRLLVGSTMEEAGFDASVTAAAVARLLGTATELVPALEEAEVEGFQVGFRPAARDGLPVMGPDPELTGLFYATGHFRNGILLAPETAARLTAMILDGDAPDPAFDPGRFGS